MTKFDDVNEAVNLLNNLKGSIENKIRTAFNLGYKQGLEDGKIEAVRDVYAWVFKEQAEQTEPSTADEDLGVPYVEVNGKDADCPWK